MIELSLYNREGKELDKIKVDEASLGGKVHRKVLRDAIIMYEACQREGNVSTKDRSEVEGSTRKPWAQKHTGRARAGTIRSPIWRHGGIIFGPKPRDFSYRMPKKMLHLALASAILSKLEDKEAVVLDSLTLEKPRTREMAKLLKSLGITKSCLIGIKNHNRGLHLATRNIPKVSLMPIKDFNAYTVMRHHNLLLTREALDEIIKPRPNDRPVGQAREKSGATKE
jgi:large subunit ribosomal protein L4